MNVQTILNDMIYLLIAGYGFLVVAKVLSFINKKIDLLQTNKKISDNAILNQLIDNAQSAITDAVKCITQTYVDSLKADKSWNLETAQNAKEKAIELAKQLISADVEKAIETVYGDFETFLDTKIESVLKTIKGDK